MSNEIIPRQQSIVRSRISPSCMQLLVMFLKDREVRAIRETTRLKYMKTCKDFFLFVGPVDVRQIRPPDIRAYLGYRMQLGATRHTMQAQLAALKSMFNFAEAMGIIIVSPARTIKQGRYRRGLPKVLSREQIDHLIDSQTNVRDKALIELMYSTGARASEVCGIKVSDVNWSARTILVNGKGSKERLVPLNNRTIAMLREYLSGRTGAWMFQADGQRDQRGKVTRDTTHGYWLGVWRHSYEIVDGKLRWHTRNVRLGRLDQISREYAVTHFRKIRPELDPRPRPVKGYPLNAGTLRYIIRKAGFRAGIPNLHPHMIRHTFATHLHDGGADILTVSKFLGHASPSTTMIYTHVSQRKLQEAIEKFHPHWS